MRKNSPRKWLHACLDLLPVILIPVFMIYSHRHDISDGSIQVQTKESIVFNQLKVNGRPTSLDTYQGSSSTISFSNEMLSCVATSTYGRLCSSVNRLSGHTYIATARLCTASSSYYISGLQINRGDDTWTGIQVYGQEFKRYSVKFTQVVQMSHYDTFRVGTDNHTSSWQTFYAKDIMLFDLTEMGLEDISIDDFNTRFSDDYYEYTESKKILIDGDLVTYDDTDIMSQFTYQLYNAVDKYFNMGNVFNMNGVYDWFNLNIFNGSAPIYIYVVWQIVLYEFVMDLLFLLYGLFMWFIDMVEHIMNKPFKSIK